MNQSTVENIKAYREYSKQGILAAMAINSGALIASLSNIETLAGKSHAESAFRAWVAGLVVATLCWFFAYMANAAYSHGKECQNLIWSWIGIAAFMISVGFFSFGGWEVSKVLMSSALGTTVHLAAIG